MDQKISQNTSNFLSYFHLTGVTPEQATLLITPEHIQKKCNNSKTMHVRFFSWGILKEYWSPIHKLCINFILSIIMIELQSKHNIITPEHKKNISFIWKKCQ